MFLFHSIFVCKEHNGLVVQGVKAIQTQNVGIHFLTVHNYQLDATGQKEWFFFPFCFNTSFSWRITESEGRGLRHWTFCLVKFKFDRACLHPSSSRSVTCSSWNFYEIELCLNSLVPHKSKNALCHLFFKLILKSYFETFRSPEKPGWRSAV